MFISWFVNWITALEESGFDCSLNYVARSGFARFLSRLFNNFGLGMETVRVTVFVSDFAVFFANATALFLVLNIHCRTFHLDCSMAPLRRADEPMSPLRRPERADGQA